MKIAVDYVGVSNGAFLAQHNEGVAVGVVPDNVDLINRKQSLIEDAEISSLLCIKPLNFKATLDKHDAYARADFANIATSTH